MDARSIAGASPIRLAAALALAAFGFGCGSYDITPAEPLVPASVAIGPASVTLVALGQTVPLTATVRADDGRVIDNAAVAWNSGDDAVATVSSSGAVTARGNGTTWIAAVAGAASDTVEVTVDQRPARLAVGPPQGADIAAGLDLAVEVVIEDSLGSRVEGAAAAVTLALEPNDQGAVATGTLAADAVDGVAAFEGVRISRAGRAFVLSASADGLSGVSDPFSVRLRLTSISADAGTVCALSHAGEAYCWGRNLTGGLGRGSGETDPTRPGLVAGGLTFTQVDAGASSNVDDFKDGGACGVTADGTAYCWGRNDYGQLGDGNGGMDSEVPVPVAGEIAFQAIGLGRDHACGLDLDGKAFCWGSNVVGQLGDGNMGVDGDVPVAVAGGLTYSEIFVGSLGTCARATSGDVYCWGGGGPSAMPGSPLVDEPTLLGGELSFAQVSPGPTLHLCGAAVDGQGYCWGQDTDGELGTGTPGQDEALPALVTGGHAWAYIGAGGWFTCGLRTDGAVLCWGKGVNGQLGTGPAAATAAEPTPITGGLTFAQLSIGVYTVCGLTADEAAYCWGAGYDGERGDGTTVLDQGSPVPVVTP